MRSLAKIQFNALTLLVKSENRGNNGQQWKNNENAMRKQWSMSEGHPSGEPRNQHRAPRAATKNLPADSGRRRLVQIRD